MIRTHEAGTLTASAIGTTVRLAGWVDARRDHGGVVFIDLRDGSGIVQCVIREELVDSLGAHKPRSEFVLAAFDGVVEASLGPRPVNPNMATGRIEVAVSGAEVLNLSAPLPFPIDERVNVGEDVRLHRYLDLRRPRQAEAIRLRSKITHTIRRVLDDNAFIDIETPTLTRSTPEGARDFPGCRPGCIRQGYALPQSPQLFKQLLMVAGMERAIRSPGCYRDEDFRADRQPEFTQLDIEMSFVNQDDVMALSEEVMAAVWGLIGVDLPRPMPRLTLGARRWTATARTSRPRFGNEIRDLTDFFAETPFRVFQSEYVGSGHARRRPSRGDSSTPGRNGQSSAAPVGWPTSPSPRTANWAAPSPRTSRTPRRPGIAEQSGAQPGDAIFFAAGERPPRSCWVRRDWRSPSAAT